jgi:hypothetical protein
MKFLPPALTILCLCALLPASGNAAANLTGTWTQPDLGMTLALSPDGAYRFEQPAGLSQGRYETQGAVLQLQDAATFAIAGFWILGLDAATLTLRDGTGATVAFRRDAPPAAAAAADVLATRNGHSLFRSAIGTAAGLVQFITGTPVTPDEMREMERQSIVEFQTDPALFNQQIGQLAQALQTLQTLSDPAQIGLGRQQLFAELHLATRSIPPTDRPLLIQLLERRIQVLAVDAANRLVLTDRDVDGMLRYMLFIGQVQPQPLSLTPALQSEFTATLIRQFPTLALEQKQMLCMASILWTVMEANWNRMSPDQRRQFQQSLAGQYAAPAPGAVPSAPAAASMSMADWNANQNLMQIMNDMSLQNHAVSMNIIENMGGTGNYWDVVDKPSWMF